MGNGKMIYRRGPNQFQINLLKYGVADDIQQLKMSRTDPAIGRRESLRVREMKKAGIGYQVVDRSGPLKEDYRI